MILPSEDDIVIGGTCPKCGGSFISCNCENDKTIKYECKTDWSLIIKEFSISNYGVTESQLDLWEWLKKYYNSPTKK